MPTLIVGPQDPTRSWYAPLRLDRKRWLEWNKRGQQDVEIRAHGETSHGAPFAREALRSVAAWRGAKWGLDLEALRTCLRRPTGR